MVMRTATLRLQLLDAVSGPSKATTAALRNLESSIAKLGAKGAPGAKNLIGQLEHLRQKSAAVGQFTELRRGLASTFGQFREARSHVRQLEAALGSVTKPTAKMNADLRSARSALKQATSAYQEQRTAVNNAATALRAFGTNSRAAADAQPRIRREIAQTIREMRRLEQEARKKPPQQQPPQQPRRPPSSGGSSYSAAAGAAGAYGTYQGGRIFTKAFGDTVGFDQVRAFRDALAGEAFDAGDRDSLDAQAKKIGYETRFTNADVVVGQLGLLQGGIRDAKQIENAMQPITDYALAMSVTLEEATETIRSSAQILQVPLTDAEAIRAHINRLVWMAKNAGMSNDDVRQYIRYGGSSMKSLGISDDVAAAMGVVLRRAGTPGDEAGVFARTATAKLGAPTNPGRMALQSMGLNFDDYASWPDAFKVEGIAKMVKEQFGTHISQSVQDEITDFIENETYFHPDLQEDMPVGTDRGTFVAGVMERLESSMGKLSKLEQNKLAKSLGDFHKFSAESVDSERLLMDILGSNPSIAQLNAFFTQRQGNRANILASRFGEFQSAIDTMKNPPADIARQIGTDANKGLYGDFTRATGAVETALITFIEDWQGPIRAVLQSVDHLASEFTQLSGGTRKVIEAFILLAGAMGGYAAMKAGKGILGRVLGAGAAGAAGAGAAGAAAGTVAGGAAKKGLLRMVFTHPLAIGAGVSAALAEADPEGNLWGLTSGVDEWMKQKTGVNPSNVVEQDSKGVPGWKRILMGKAADPDFNFRKNMEVAISPSARKQNALQGDLASATADWPVAAQQGMQGYLAALTSGGDQAEAEAQAIADGIKTTLEVTAHPSVNTGQLERALQLAQQLASALRSMPGAPAASGGASAPAASPPASPAPVKVDGHRARGGGVQKDKLYEVGERGRELFSPSENGSIIPANRVDRVNGGGIYAPISLTVNVKGGDKPADIAKLVEDAARRAVMQALSALDRQLNRGNRMPFSDLQYGDS